MANYTRSLMVFTLNPSIPASCEDYKKLEALLTEALEEGNWIPLYEAFELDPYDSDVYFDDDGVDYYGGTIDIAVFSKGFFPIYNLTEVALDNFGNCSLSVVWCDEFEKSFEVPDEDWKTSLDFDTWFSLHTSGGAFNHVVVGYDEDSETCYDTTRQKAYNGKENKECWFWPRTPEERHEVFVLAWDGWRPPDGGSVEPFFNQNNLDESKIMVKGVPFMSEPFGDGEPGFAMYLSQWMKLVFDED